MYMNIVERVFSQVMGYNHGMLQYVFLKKIPLRFDSYKGVLKSSRYEIPTGLFAKLNIRTSMLQTQACNCQIWGIIYIHWTYIDCM